MSFHGIIYFRIATKVIFDKNLRMKSHVILIDDNPVANTLHEHMLQELDHNIQVSIFDNGLSALDFLKREFSDNKIDIKTTIFLDEQMPGLGGLEILEILEDLEMTDESNIDVYFLTADTSLRLIEKSAVMLNVKQVVHKPLTREFLKDYIL
jgi:CheY-like chemotaxis protein